MFESYIKWLKCWPEEAVLLFFSVPFLFSPIYCSFFTCLKVYSFLELFTFVLWCISYYRALKPKPPERYSDRRRLRAMIKRVIQSDGRIDAFGGWFKDGADMPMGKEDLRILLAWAYFGKDLNDLTLKEMEIANGDIENFTAKITPIEEGKKRDMCYCHTLMPFSAFYYPVIIYMVLGFIKGIMFVFLLILGFKRHKSGRLVYWKRFKSSPEVQKPLIFLPGLGIGLLQYFLLVRNIRYDNVILFEFPWVSLRLIWGWIREPLGRKEYLKCVRGVYKTNEIIKAKIVAHSYGTFWASVLALDAPDLIDGFTLIDPVALYLMIPVTSPRVLFTGLFGGRTDSFLYIIFNFVIFFIRHELGIARTLTRYFWWHNVVLTCEYLPKNSTIMIHGGDEIVPVDHIRKNIKKSPRKDINFIDFPFLTHAGFIYNRNSFNQVCALVDPASEIDDNGPGTTSC